MFFKADWHPGKPSSRTDDLQVFMHQFPLFFFGGGGSGGRDSSRYIDGEVPTWEKNVLTLFRKETRLFRKNQLMNKVTVVECQELTCCVVCMSNKHQLAINTYDYRDKCPSKTPSTCFGCSFQSE